MKGTWVSNLPKQWQLIQGLASCPHKGNKRTGAQRGSGHKFVLLVGGRGKQLFWKWLLSIWHPLYWDKAFLGKSVDFHPCGNWGWCWHKSTCCNRTLEWLASLSDVYISLLGKGVQGRQTDLEPKKGQGPAQCDNMNYFALSSSVPALDLLQACWLKRKIGLLCWWSHWLRNSPAVFEDSLQPLIMLWDIFTTSKQKFEEAVLNLKHNFLFSYHTSWGATEV